MTTSPWRPALFAFLAAAAVGGGCIPAVPSASTRQEWPDLTANVRPPIIRDTREIDEDLLDYQKSLEQHAKDEEARLNAQPKVTAAFVELAIRDALFEISTQTKVPIVLDQSVTGNVTLNLANAPLETALRLVCFSGGYAFSTDGKAYYVGTPDPQGVNYSVLTTSRVLPTYMTPKQIVSLLHKNNAAYCSWSEGSNKLTLTGPSSVLDRLESEIRLLDRPPAQIMLEALVVETKFGTEYAVGLDYGNLQATLTKEFSRTTNGQAPNFDQFDAISKLSLTFDLLEGRNLATVHSHPKIMTTNGQPAEIRSMVETYVVINRPSATFVTSELQIIKTGTILKVTPQITRNGEIEETIEPEFADVIGATSDASGSLPVVSRRTVRSTVRLKNRDVLVIGGLYENSARNVLRGLPFLKDVPVLDLVTSNRSGASSATELLIFLAPKVVK